MTKPDTPSQESYALAATGTVADIPAPELAYRPPMPKDRSATIGLIGAGGISAAHLEAYRAYGFNVVAICDHTLARAAARRDAYFPHARVTKNDDELLADPSIRVLDLAMHTRPRGALIRRAIEAGKHVLSQKPYVDDLALGAELADLAADRGLFLAVNQNGRWAPYMSYMREAVRAGLVGDIISVHAQLQWDHSWIGGTAFEDIDHIILEDFAIHWFDFVCSIIGDTASSVYAVANRAAGQTIRPPLLAQAMIGFAGGQASLVFDGASRRGPQNLTTIVGTKGTLCSTGPDLGQQAVRLYSADGVSTPPLEGQWFNDGFAGAMGALLVAIETGVPPIHNARDNLVSLRLARAALRSADSGAVVRLDR